MTEVNGGEAFMNNAGLMYPVVRFIAYPGVYSYNSGNPEGTPCLPIRTKFRY
jgi:hypothetical protein